MDVVGQWVGVALCAALALAIVRLAPEVIPIFFICIPIAYFVGLETGPRRPIWVRHGKDRT